jgi:hypothetical protein
MDSINLTWLIIIFVVFFAAFTIAALKSRGLPKKRQGQIIQKYLAIPTIIFLLFILFSKPFVTSISFISSSGKEIDYPRNLDSKEVALEIAQNHHSRIRDLETEVQRLRKDLYETVTFDRTVLQMMAIALIVSVLLNAFLLKKEKQKAREEEMQEIYEEVKARMTKESRTNQWSEGGNSDFHQT